VTAAFLTVHAGLIAARVGGRWRGVLVEGPSGAGKSDLMLRALGQGFRLVADDRVILWASGAGGQVFGRAPDALAGLIEARGLGIVPICTLGLAEVALVLRPGDPERMPEPAFADLLGSPLPRLDLAYREASAPAKLRHALAAFDAGSNRRI
jgi:serine kinase of HPr protein (carbohydrate metabolism regulator)